MNVLGSPTSRRIGERRSDFSGLVPDESEALLIGFHVQFQIGSVEVTPWNTSLDTAHIILDAVNDDARLKKEGDLCY